MLKPAYIPPAVNTAEPSGASVSGVPWPESPSACPLKAFALACPGANPYCEHPGIATVSMPSPAAGDGVSHWCRYTAVAPSGFRLLDVCRRRSGAVRVCVSMRHGVRVICFAVSL